MSNGHNRRLRCQCQGEQTIDIAHPPRLKQYACQLPKNQNVYFYAFNQMIKIKSSACRTARRAHSDSWSCTFQNMELWVVRNSHKAVQAARRQRTRIRRLRNTASSDTTHRGACFESHPRPATDGPAPRVSYTAPPRQRRALVSAATRSPAKRSARHEADVHPRGAAPRGVAFTSPGSAPGKCHSPARP